MEIIVLQGPPNRGKTTTIGLAYDLVLNNGGTSTNRRPLGGDPNDFSDIVINYKGKKIAFFSMGDNSTELARAIYDYARQNCDLMICALSTGTSKIRANNALNQFATTRLDKTIGANSGLKIAANLTDAQRIFALI